MAELLQAIASGVLLGGVYALLSIGLSMVFGVMDIVNIAHAAFALLCSYVAYWLFKLLGVDPLASLGITIPMMLLLGLLVYKGLIARVREAPALMSLLLLFGLANVFEGSMLMLWTGDIRTISPFYAATSFQAGGVVFSTTRLIGFAASMMIIASLILFLKKTYPGKALRSTIQNKEAAILMGVNTDRAVMLGFILGIATAAPGGTFLGVIYAFSPSIHLLWIGKLFCIVVLGGLGNLGGAFLGSMILGVAENITGTYLPVVWSEVVAYIILITTLLLRPTGIFGAKRALA